MHWSYNVKVLSTILCDIDPKVRVIGKMFVFVCFLKSLPVGALDWPVVCNCGISWSYSPGVVEKSEYTTFCNI